MDEFNSDDYYTYYCVQGSLRRNGVALIVSKRLHQYLGTISKMKTMILVHFQGKSFNITVIEVYAPTTDAKEAEVDWFLEDLKHLLELTSQKDAFFITGEGNAKVGSREIAGIIGKFGPGVQNESEQITAFCQVNMLVIANPFPTQEMSLHMNITKWSILESG